MLLKHSYGFRIHLFNSFDKDLDLLFFAENGGMNIPIAVHMVTSTSSKSKINYATSEILWVTVTISKNLCKIAVEEGSGAQCDHAT